MPTEVNAVLGIERYITPGSTKMVQVRSASHLGCCSLIWFCLFCEAASKQMTVPLM